VLLGLLGRQLLLLLASSTAPTSSRLRISQFLLRLGLLEQLQLMPFRFRWQAQYSLDQQPWTVLSMPASIPSLPLLFGLWTHLFVVSVPRLSGLLTHPAEALGLDRHAGLGQLLDLSTRL